MSRSERAWVGHTARAPNLYPGVAQVAVPAVGSAVKVVIAVARGERSSCRRASCSALLGVIQPDVLFGHAALQESALDSPGLLTVLEQQSEVALGREAPVAQLPLADLSSGQS
jgi:hypothetical protein